MFSTFSLRFSVLICLLLFNIAAAENHQKSFKPVDLKITTHLGDNQKFREGDQISFMISLDHAAYIYLFYQDVNAQIVQLLPNQHQHSIIYKPGFFIPIPDQNSQFNFTIQEPFGEDSVWVFATDSPVPELDGTILKNGLKLLNLTIDQIRSKIKYQVKSIYGESSIPVFTEAEQ